MNINTTIEKPVFRPVSRPLADDKFERELLIARAVSDAFLAAAISREEVARRARRSVGVLAR